MFFLSSDNHGSVDLRFGQKAFPAGKYLKRSDKVAFLGDEELHLYNAKGFEFLSNQSWTSLLIEGNHDHLPTYFNAPLVEFCGGNARQLADNIYYLQRGEVYEIDGKRFFVMGGALSIDRDWRKEGFSWWPEEVPSEEDFKFAEQRLEGVNWEVDYVLTHTCPFNCIDLFFLPVHPNDKYFDQAWIGLERIRKRLNFKHWYFGHWHRDVQKESDRRKYTIIYREIRALEKMKDQELKTAVFSDTHGQWKTMFERAQKADCRRILHCGDMDFLMEDTEKELKYFPTPQKYKIGYRDGTKPVELKDYIEGVPIETYAIYGNHEGFSHLYRMLEGPYKILPELNIFGRYGQTEIETGVGKLKVAGLSGVYSEKYSHLYNYDGSPYRWHPKHGRDCSPKNAAYLHEKDVNHIALTYNNIDILLLHENPIGRHNGRNYGFQIINDLIEMLEPKLVFCGHMHFAERRQIGNSTIINVPKNDYVILEDLWRDL